MPKTNKQCPNVGAAVRFRVTGDTKLWYGTYTEEGFRVCTGFICYTMDEVDYWNYVPAAHENLSNTRRTK